MINNSLYELRHALEKGTISSVELTDAYLSRIDAEDPALNSFITVTAEHARRAALAADQARARGDSQLLTGLPMAHKDIFCTRGIKTSCGSKMLDNFTSPYDATVVTKLAAAGAVMLGKTNMDEFAMGSTNETSFYGAVKNPWDPNRIPGGSSGGSAAAVSAGLTPLATGTDTGGSIRQPAALCGITGLKPTYGRVSRWGMVAFASSLDQAGPMATSAADCALALQAMAGHDPKDSTSANVSVPDYLAALTTAPTSLRIGLPDEYFSEALSDDVRTCIEESIRLLEAQGHQIKSISLPHTHYAQPAYYVIAPAECSSNLARFDGVRYGHRCTDPQSLQDLYCRSRSEGFGNEVKRRILIGSYVLSAGYYDAYYKQAQRVRRLIREDFVHAFREVDVILAPTTPTTAFSLHSQTDNPCDMYSADIFTLAVNLAGLPALALPCGISQRLPVGMQLIGADFNEAMLLQLGHQYQQHTDWHQRTPSKEGTA